MTRKNRSRSRASKQSKESKASLRGPSPAGHDLAPALLERAKAHANALCKARRDSHALEERLRDDHGLSVAIEALREDASALAPEEHNTPDASEAYPKDEAFAKALNAMFGRKAYDLLLEIRPSKSPSWHMRSAGEMIPLDSDTPMPDAGAFLHEAAKALGMENADGSEIDWESCPKQGFRVKDCGSHRLLARFQSHPVRPAGLSVILRATASLILTAKQQEARDKRESEIKRLIKQRPLRRSENERAYANEMAAKLGDRGPEHEALFAAIEAGDSEKLQRMLDSGADPHWRIWPQAGSMHFVRNMSTPLIFAAALGQAECVRILLPVSEADAVSFHGETALHAATRGSHFECMRLLIPASLVDAPDFSGQSALANAVWVNNVEAARLLAPSSTVNLGSGCLAPLGDICVPEPHCTALWLAAQEGYAECCKILIGHGADPRISDPQGKTPMANSRLDRRAIKALRAQAARLDERDELSAAVANPGARRSPSRI